MKNLKAAGLTILIVISIPLVIGTLASLLTGEWNRYSELGLFVMFIIFVIGIFKSIKETL